MARVSRSWFVLLACALIGLTSCQPGRRIRKANVDQVLDGMAKKQVESILGMPTSTETKDYAGAKRTTYTYVQGKDTVVINFREDKVESKESTLRD
jgi:outer membrane protein assembly factor BamE (lipoprotein component of BamABCDE complex)